MGLEDGADTAAASLATGELLTGPPVAAQAGPSVADASQSPAYVYAIGRVEPRFPSLTVEKEFAQATGRAETTAITDREALHSVLTDRANRYLVRQLCWILAIEGLETYLLTPRDPLDLDLLIEAIRPRPSPLDMDVVVGVRGPLAPPEMCNGLIAPIVAFDQIWSFDRWALVAAIPRPEPGGKRETAKEVERFNAGAEELLDRIMQLADNAGATDEHRALNYLAVRYDRIYVVTSEMHQRNFALDGVEVRSSRLSGVRKVVSAIFAYRHRETDVGEKYFVRVDVTEEFPFLVSRLQPFYER
jgi:hypothetical protein